MLSPIWKARCRRAANAIGTLVLLFLSFSLYLYLRRGYYDLYIVNKALANVAAAQLGMVLLTGPISRLIHSSSIFIQYQSSPIQNEHKPYTPFQHG